MRVVLQVKLEQGHLCSLVMIHPDDAPRKAKSSNVTGFWTFLHYIPVLHGRRAAGVPGRAAPRGKPRAVVPSVQSESKHSCHDCPRDGCLTAGARELTAAACAFGNTLTLPLVFLAALLPAAACERAVGYTALFLMGWSPLLWSLGYQLLGSAGDLADETSALLRSL